jgi:hypothetical protein
MTDSKSEMDWADEIVGKLVHGVSSSGDSDFVCCHMYEIAAALRAAELRGRIAGLREAAKIAWKVLDTYKKSNGPENDWAFYSCHMIICEADKLEKENTPLASPPQIK